VGAIVVGIFLMVKGGGGSAATPAGDQIAATTTTTSPPAGSAPTSTVSSATLPPAQVKIVAANGSSVKGLAGKTKTQLAAAGYTNVVATDTNTGSAPVTSSLIYYIPGAEADAKAVARAAGFSADRVAQLPAATTQVPVSGIAGARVVMLLGPDSPAAGTPASTTTVPRQVTTTTAAK
jgi:hypothetical protein